MHLSESVLLGHHLKASNALSYISSVPLFKRILGRPNMCGCALGGALLAVTPEDSWKNLIDLDNREFFDKLAVHFPWLTYPSTSEDRITSWYYSVHQGMMSIEQLAQNIRNIEPDCGECNEFVCACTLEQALSQRSVDFSHLGDPREAYQ